MDQFSSHQLRSLRLDAHARDNQVVSDLNEGITNGPDTLVKELMEVHGRPAHEALDAVQRLQEKALQGTADQAAA